MSDLFCSPTTTVRSSSDKIEYFIPSTSNAFIGIDTNKTTNANNGLINFVFISR